MATRRKRVQPKAKARKRPEPKARQKSAPKKRVRSAVKPSKKRARSSRPPTPRKARLPPIKASATKRAPPALPTPKGTRRGASSARSSGARSAASKKGWATRRARDAARSAAAKAGWVKRRGKALRFALQQLRDRTWLPTKDELHDYIDKVADVHGIESSQLYRWYFGYSIDLGNGEVYEMDDDDVEWDDDEREAAE